MKPQTKRLLIIILIAVVVVGLGIGIYFLASGSTDPSWRIRDTSAREIVTPRNLGYSRLYINSNGTFEMEIIETIGEDNEIMFTGIGTYKRNGNTYTFKFTDSYTNPARTSGAGQLAKDEEIDLTRAKGRLVFKSHWGISFYFGR